MELDGFYINRGIERLFQLGLSGNFNNWYIQKVFSLDDIENYQFYSSFPNNCYTENIDPHIICGTSHCLYYNKTWIEMLGALKNNINFGGDKMADVILDYKLGDKGIGRYGNQYIIHGGNNRLCIGKFMNLKNIQVDVQQFEFDHESFRIYNKIKAFGFNVEYKKFNDYVLWTLKTNYFEFNIYGSGLVEKFIEYYLSLSLFKKDYFKILWSNYRKYEHKPFCHIRSVDNFEGLKLQILAFKHQLPLLSECGFGNYFNQI